MSPIHDEAHFEAAIAYDLIQNRGYLKGENNVYDATLGLFPGYVLDFLRESQPDEWDRISQVHGARVTQKLLKRLQGELDRQGILHVLRHGFTDMGIRFQMAFFPPETTLNPTTIAQAQLNRFHVTRQVFFERKGNKSIDLVLSLNGLPVATLEVKNQLTNQTIHHAEKQYKGRNPKEPIFWWKKRALVHFAVDNDQVSMCTRVNRSKTRFLPFNQGFENGAGNPPRPGYRSAYLWEEVLAAPQLLDLLRRFIYIERKEELAGGKTEVKETVIFPRYHQLDVVQQLVGNALRQGPGHNYLVQHSAGSGKSNSIAWLAYSLSTLHSPNNQRVFDSVVVVTDRRVLDSQLQDTIYQFEHVPGTVLAIDKDSNQLAEALVGGKHIIITTLQKFPFVLEKIAELPRRNYAVIIDEAHSSQGGEATKQMKEVLMGKELSEEGNDPADNINRSVEARGKQPNLSFFAFTATPKPKTLELFGERDEEDIPRPSHLYSMRQAIEEGFILNVLERYTTYKTFFQLSKAIEDDPDLNRKRANQAVGRFLSQHPHNVAEKTKVIVEHFQGSVVGKIKGKAKAMVITGSRQSAFQFYRAIQSYIQEQSYSIGVLVAFSGKLTNPDYPEGVSESQLNGFSEKELPQQFDSDRFRILVVADKYQTGFDQPLLHTMYVDKQLHGVKAVQTLSRLNRTHKHKENTFILDFVNDRESILESFQPYYEATTVDQPSDPNRLFDLKAELERYQVIWPAEVDALAQIFYADPGRFTQNKAQKELQTFLNGAVDRYRGLPLEADVAEGQPCQESFKHTLTAFVRAYSFLSQIMPFGDAGLEKFYTYCRFLSLKLPRGVQTGRLQLDEEIVLESYRLQEMATGAIQLAEVSEFNLRNPGDGGLAARGDEEAPLSDILHRINERFGTDFDEQDQLFLDQTYQSLLDDSDLALKARNNDESNFFHPFHEAYLDKTIERMDQHLETYKQLQGNPEMAKGIIGFFAAMAYRYFREQGTPWEDGPD